MRESLNRVIRWFKNWWMRRNLSDVLKQTLMVMILSGAHSVLMKEYPSPQKLKSAMRSTLKQSLAKLRLPESYETWLVEPTLVVIDRLIDEYLPDRAKVMRELEEHLREHLGIRG